MSGPRAWVARWRRRRERVRFTAFRLVPSEYGVLIFALDRHGRLWQVAVAGDAVLNGWQALPAPEEFPYSAPRRPGQA